MSFRQVSSGRMQSDALNDSHSGHVQAQSEIAGLLLANGVNAVNRGTVLAPSVSASSAIMGADITEQPASWTPDSASDHCLLCSIEFSMFRRAIIVDTRCTCLTPVLEIRFQQLPMAMILAKCSSGSHKHRPLRVGLGIMVRACDQCFTLRKLRSEQAAIISKSRLLMNLLPPEGGAEFRQALVVALAEGARQCAERLCAREDHSYNISQSMRVVVLCPRQYQDSQILLEELGMAENGRFLKAGRIIGRVQSSLQPSTNRGHHDSNDAPPVIIRPVANPPQCWMLGFDGLQYGKFWYWVPGTQVYQEVHYAPLRIVFIELI